MMNSGHGSGRLWLQCIPRGTCGRSKGARRDSHLGGENRMIYGIAPGAMQKAEESDPLPFCPYAGAVHISVPMGDKCDIMNAS